MAGATLPPFVSLTDSHRVFGTSEPIALESSVAMETSEIMDDSRSGVNSDDCSDINEGVGSLSCSSQPVLSSDEGSFKCNHCSFASSSSSEMSQHRWEVHPLLTRRKQHLMRKPGQTRKRPNSESQGDCGDDVTPSKKQLDANDVMSTRCGNLEVIENCSHVRRACSAGLHVKEEVPEIMPKQRKSISLGDLSSFRNGQNPTETARLSLIDGMATAPLVSWYSQHMTECITNLMKDSTQTLKRNESSPLNSSKLHTPTATWNPSSSSVTNASTLNGNLQTLAKAASTASKEENGKVTRNTSPNLNGSATSKTSAQSTNFSIANGQTTSGMYMSGDKLSYGYVTSPSGGVVDHSNYPVTPVSFIPYGAGGVLQQPMATYFSSAPSNSMFLNPAHIQVPSIHPGYLPAQSLFAGLPLPPRTAAAGDQTSQRHGSSKLSTLSHVATTLLNEQAQPLQQGESSDVRSSPRSPSANVNSTFKPVIAHSAGMESFAQTKQRDSNKGISCGLQMAAQALKTKLASNTEAKAESSKVQLKDAVTSLSCGAGKALRMSSTPSSERQVVSLQPMDDERVKSLEAAVLNTDCCDPNERSSVLPFRCPDGKWRMVRTKRIGGAWLVQVPGSDAPNVYLPNHEKGKRNGETLNDWLKAKLCAGNPMDIKAEKDKQIAHQRTSSMTKQYPDLDKLSTASTISSAHNDAIRNLLLQKTALA